MYAGEYYTWARAVHVEIVNSRIPPDELRNRTLELVYVDRDRNFDHIEWKLDNRDGYLTHVDRIAYGMMIKLRIGYEGSAMPWKTFIINRIRGGVGVSNRELASVGEKEAVVTYYGRNRNAPGGRTSKPWRKSAAPPPKKAKKTYPATTSVTKHDLLMAPNLGPRIVLGKTTSDIVLEIGRRHGFEASFALVEPTDDSLEGGQATIPPGMSDGTYLSILARRGGRRFSFFLDEYGLHWHSPHWKGAELKIADRLIYGGSPDILELEIDCDFRLPVPTKVTGHNYSWLRRAAHFQEVDFDKAQTSLNMATAYSEAFNDPEIAAAIGRHEIYPIAGSGKEARTRKHILQRFLKRHMRAFQINIKTVGNPKLLAGRLVHLSGTGSRIVDRALYIAEARHTVSDLTYVTEVKAKHPPKRYAGAVAVGHFQEVGYDKDSKQLNMATVYYKGGWAARQRVTGIRGR